MSTDCRERQLELRGFGARIRVSCRRVWMMLSTAYPHKELFWRAFEQLQPVRRSPA